MSRRDPSEPDPPWEGPEPLQPSEEPEALPLPEFDAAEPEALPLPEFNAAEPEALPLPEFDAAEPEALPLPAMDAAEPEVVPLPEWPSLEALQRMTAPIPDVPQPSEEPDRPIDAPPPAPPQAGAGEWHRFSVQGDGVLQSSPPNVASFGGQDDREVMRNILRRLDEVVSILRQMT